MRLAIQSASARPDAKGGAYRGKLSLHRGFDGRSRGARLAGSCDDFCLALHEAIEGRRHCVDVFYRHDEAPWRSACIKSPLCTCML